MNPEIIILTEVRERQISYDIAYVQNIQKMVQMNIIYKMEIESQM